MTRQQKRGEFLAQIELGRIYSRGIGVPADPHAARRWYSAAATQEASVGDCEELQEAKAYTTRPGDGIPNPPIPLPPAKPWGKGMIDPSLKKKLAHEDRWSRTYQAGENTFACESKFETDALTVSAEEIISAWGLWNQSERLSFVNAYRSRTKAFDSDEKIFEFLMANGDEPVWSTIASSLALYHPNKEMVLNFLLERLRSGSEPKANFIQALYVLGDVSVLPHLHDLYSRLSEEIKLTQGEPGSWTICDFLKCCEALDYLEKAERHREEIRPFLKHPDEVVRIHAQMALDGPQPEELGIIK